MDTFDYQRSSVPARMPAQRATSLTPQRFDGNSAENTPSVLSVQAVLRASRRYWWLILALWTLGSAGFGAAVYLRVKPQYRASSWLKVDPTQIDLYGGIAHEGVEPYMQTHVALITSPNVLTASVARPEVQALPRIRDAGDPIQELGRVISVSIRPGTHIIEVAMVSTVAQEAATLVNAVVDDFLEINRNLSSGTTQKTIEKLTNYNKELEATIKRSEQEMRESVKRQGQTGTVLLRNASDRRETKAEANERTEKEAAFNITVNSYQRMQEQCSSIKIDLLTAEANLEEAKRIAQIYSAEMALPGGPKTNSNLDDERAQLDPHVADIRDRLAQARMKYKKIAQDTKFSGDPAQMAAGSLVKKLERELKLAVENKKMQLRSNPETALNEPQAEVARAEKVVRDLVLRKNALEELLNKTKLETANQQSEAFEYQLLVKDHEEYQGLSQAIRRKLEQLNFDSSGTEERIQLINEARVEGTPIADKRMQYMAMAPVGVLGAVLALVVLLEIRSGRVADTDVLSSRMKHEVFAIAPLPNIRPGLGSDGDKAEQRLARFVQSLDHLRVALCEGGTNGEGRCVMITSATGGEGKTTLSAHLAARCANAGTSTLLIDADMRRASLGRLLDLPPGPGLGDLLAGEVELDGGLIAAQAAGFHFLSAGTPGIDPTRVLKSTRLAELIGQLRQMYDLVIIDTPPVLPVADALILGRWADGAVVAARYDASRLPMVERANRQIIAAGIPVLGVVVNGVKGQDQAYGNYAYSYSYPGRQEPLNDGGNAS